MAQAEPRYVFDTNTLVSAALFEGSTPGRAFRLALRTGALLASPETLAELSEVLSRGKLERYVTQEEREEFFGVLVARAEIVEPTETVSACRDPKDDKFLELALEGRATAIISGDKDLLVLHPFRGVSIVTAATFLTPPPM